MCVCVCNSVYSCMRLVFVVPLIAANKKIQTLCNAFNERKITSIQQTHIVCFGCPCTRQKRRKKCEKKSLLCMQNLVQWGDLSNSKCWTILCERGALFVCKLSSSHPIHALTVCYMSRPFTFTLALFIRSRLQVSQPRGWIHSHTPHNFLVSEW